jgi:hypothetical protein
VALASSLSYAATGLLSSFFFRRVTGIRSARTLLPGRDELRDYRQLIGPAMERIRRR